MLFGMRSELAYKYLHEFNISMSEYMVNFIKYDPLFESIRHEAEFKKIMAEVESNNIAEKRRVKQWLVENDLYEFSSN